MFQVAIGVGTDELAPEIFIGVDYGDGDRCFRLGGKRVSALVAELSVFLVLLLALRAGFHLPESSTIKTPPGKEATRLCLTPSAAPFKLLPSTGLCYLPLLYKGIRLSCRQKN